jgi:hypothetical protein
MSENLLNDLRTYWMEQVRERVTMNVSHLRSEDLPPLNQKLQDILIRQIRVLLK